MDNKKNAATVDPFLTLFGLMIGLAPMVELFWQKILCAVLAGLFLMIRSQMKANRVNKEIDSKK